MKNIIIYVLIVLVIVLISFILFQNRDKGDLNPIETISSKSLSLENKNLTKVPDWVFKETNITSLNLSNNKLEGSIQGEIRFLAKLKVLDLSDNELTGVPAEIGQLKDLEILDLSNNKLTGLPNELGNLSNLKELNLTGNNYSERDLSAILKTLPKSVVVKK